MFSTMQVIIIFFITFIQIKAEAPPGYVKSPENIDIDQPKYQYGYNIEDEKGIGQGKLETRDGIYALGRYYVQGTESSQNVQYYADDWGFHPFVEYSNVGPHSKTKTKFILGTEALKALKNKKFSESSISPKDQINDNIEKINNEKQKGRQLHVMNIENESSTMQLEVQQQQQQPPQPTIIIEQPQKSSNQIYISPLVNNAEQQTQDVFIQPQEQSQQNVQTSSQPPLQTLIIQQQQQQHPQGQNLLKEQLSQETVYLQDQTQNEAIEQNQAQSIVYFESRQPINQNIIPQDQIVFYEQPQQEQEHQHQQQQQQQQQNFIIEQTQPAILVDQNQITNIKTQDEINEKNVDSESILQSSNKTYSEEMNEQQEQLLREAQSEIDESALTETFSNSFGSKINVKIESDKSPASYVFQKSVQPPMAMKLIQDTKDLINGQDVLNINRAIDEENISTATESTVNSLVTGYKIEHSTKNEVANVEISGVSSFTSSATESPPSVEISLSKQPIVVAELEENSIQSSTENYVTLKTTNNNFSSTTPTILVTPRPVSSTFLAPITAGIQLQNIDKKVTTEKHNYYVDIQKSLPYYLGKFEYVHHDEQKQSKKEDLEARVNENLQLGKILLNFPTENEKPRAEPLIQELPKVEAAQNFAELELQELPSPIIKTNFLDNDQQQAQGLNHNVFIQQVHRDEKPYRVHIVENTVPVPVTVEKPVPITHIIEKPIPQPYPVEKIIEKPVHIPIEVTRYVDRPYPVQIPVAQPVPYPVDRIVEKIVKQPYPVEVRVPVEIKVPVPVEKIVEKKIHVPQYIEKPVPIEKIIEKPIPHFIDRPYPVEVKIPVPVPTQSYVLPLDIPKPYQVIKPHAYQQPFKSNQLTQHSHQIPKYTVYFNNNNLNNNNNNNINKINNNNNINKQQQQLQQQFLYANPYNYAPTHSMGYLPPKFDTQSLKLEVSNSYLPPKHNCDQQKISSTKNFYYTIKPDDYIGLLPPKYQGTNLKTYPRKFRSARSSFNNNLRLEYGFMPPLIPSQEIDENGRPIDRE